jgi:hypothetical protein
VPEGREPDQAGFGRVIGQDAGASLAFAISSPGRHRAFADEVVEPGEQGGRSASIVLSSEVVDRDEPTAELPDEGVADGGWSGQVDDPGPAVGKGVRDSSPGPGPESATITPLNPRSSAAPGSRLVIAPPSSAASRPPAVRLARTSGRPARTTARAASVPIAPAPTTRIGPSRTGPRLVASSRATSASEGRRAGSQLPGLPSGAKGEVEQPVETGRERATTPSLLDARTQLVQDLVLGHDGRVTSDRDPDGMPGGVDTDLDRHAGDGLRSDELLDAGAWRVELHPVAGLDQDGSSGRRARSCSASRTRAGTGTCRACARMTASCSLMRSTGGRP